MGEDCPRDDWDAALPLTVSAGHNRTRVELAVCSQGRDLILTVTGGSAHVGAVAVHAPGRKDLAGTPGEPHTNSTVVPGHKEGPLAEAGAAVLAEATGRTCVAVVGIHQDQATSEEIAAIVANVRRGYEPLAAALTGLASS